MVRIHQGALSYCKASQPNTTRHPGGEGWLVNAQEQLVVQFKPDNPTAHAEWVSVETYSWVPPHPSVPKTRQRMLELMQQQQEAEARAH